MRENKLLFFILLAFALLAGWFAGFTPYRTGGFLFNQRMTPVNEIGNPDERQHANYMAHVMNEGTIPVLKPGSPELGETYQSHQPPLYYFLGVATAKLTGADPVEASGKTIRYLNVVVGLFTLWGVFSAARWGLRRDEVALAATAFVAFNPMFIALNAAITNDALLFAFCTWGFAWSLRLAAPESGWREAGLVALFSGLAIWTKMSGVVMIPVGLAAVVLRRERLLPNFAVVVLGALVIASPWLLRNTNLYGDPLGLKVFGEAFVGSPKSSEMAAALGFKDFWVDLFGWWTARSFFGAFGQMDIFYSPTVYRLLFAASILLLLGLMFLRKSEQESQPTAYRVLAWTFALVVVAQFMRFNMQFFQAQSRYLFPAIAVFGILLALGLKGWAKERMPLATLVLVGLLIVGNISAGVYAQGQFERRITGQR